MPFTYESTIHEISGLADLFIQRGIPTHLRSDNGPQGMCQEGSGVAIVELSTKFLSKILGEAF
jgi:hypothetical protein